MAEGLNSPAALNSVDSDDTAFDDVETAITGINMLLNNGFDEAFVLFEKYKDESALMHSGYSFVFFMQALMSFEEEKLAEALKVLQETEKRCEVSDGFVKSFKRKFSKKKKTAELLSVEERVQRQVIVADAVLYQAILVFTNQDIPSYIKGGWHLRKAWKIYDRLHREVSALKESLSASKIHRHQAGTPWQHDPRQDPNSRFQDALGPQPGGPQFPTNTSNATAAAHGGSSPANNSPSTVANSSGSPVRSEASEVNGEINGGGGGDSAAVVMTGTEMKDEEEARVLSSASATAGAATTSSTSTSSSSSSSSSTTSSLSEETVGRLLGAVNFGYGTFQLCISMVPPKILKLIEFLGFEGDRELGLACLDYTSHSRDMKAPLATLGLLWYHTVLRPFFALDGANNYCAGTHDAEAIIQQKEAAFPNSSLFLFFRGRIHRLRKESELSYEMYNRAYEEAKGQREIELMCLYEISWCNLLKLNWEKSMEGFDRLRKESKWSKCYYSYLMAVCLGAQGLIEDSHAMFREVPALMKRKNNQIEVFCARRAERVKKEPPSQEFCRLLTLELVFLWHTLPTCSQDDLRRLMDICDMQTDPKVFHLKCLLEGAIFKELGETEMAVQCLKEALARHQGKKEDGHVAAFTLFELAAIYMKSPQTKQLAREHLQLIKDSYKDYDFENRLSVRVNNALKQLKRNSGTPV